VVTCEAVKSWRDWCGDRSKRHVLPPTEASKKKMEPHL